MGLDTPDAVEEKQIRPEIIGIPDSASGDARGSV